MIHEDANHSNLTKRELQKQHDELLNIIHSLPALMVMLDDNFDIIYCNERAIQTFLLTAKQIRFKKWCDYMPGYSSSAISRMLHVAFRKNILLKKNIECEFHFDNQKKVTISWQLTFARHKNKKVVLCTGFDVTNFKHASGKLTEQNKQLKEFAHLVSHNLRGPVVNSLSLVQLYKRSNNHSDREEFIDKLESSICKMLSNIEDFSEILKKYEKALDTEEVLFDNILKDTILLFSELITETQAQINGNFTACPSVNYRRLIIESIFQNLISNSIKYRNILTRPQISITSHTADNKHILVFEDNGIGIDLNKNGDKVFGLYKTFHDNTDARGVGLYLIKNQVEEFGGKVLLESEPGKGSKFTIVL